MSGVGTAPAVAGIAVGLGMTTHGAYGFASSAQDMQNALEGTSYGSPAEQIGAALGGEQGENIGKVVDKAMTVLDGAKAARKLAVDSVDTTAKVATDTHAVMDVGKDMAADSVDINEENGF